MRLTRMLLPVISAAIVLCLIRPVGGVVTVDPHGMAVVVEQDQQLEREMTLANTGNPVEYNIWIIPQLLGGDNLELGPVRDDRSEPDEMGYEWRDDEEDDCPPYDWIDITEFEDVIDIEGLEDDSLAGEFEFDFQFEYYGNEFDVIAIFPNGMAVLGGDPGNIFYFYPIGQWQQDLPNNEGNPPPPPNLLCVAYQDLNPLVAGHIYFWTSNAMAVCTWEDIPHWVDENAEGDLWTLQAVFFRSGLVKFQYAAIGEYDNADIMIGFQNDDCDLGFTVMRNDFDYLEPERVVAFGPEEAWITWATVDPVSGEIPRNEEEIITVTFNAENIEEGVYYAILDISIDDPGLQEVYSIEVPLLMSVDSPVGSIEGVVTDAMDNELLEGAPVVLEPFGLMRLTDDQGHYEMDNIPVGVYDMTCDYGYYLPFMEEDVEVVENETAEVDMALLHAECNPDVENNLIEVDLQPDEQRNVEFNVANDGNGDLEYTVYRYLAGGVRDPWELRLTYPLGETLQDSRLEGVIFDGEHFFVSGANRWGGEDSTNMIYVIDREGEFVRRFEQVGEADYGMTDLAWDGGLIWGSGERIVYGFSREGEVGASWSGPYGNNRALAWDPDREMLWVAGITNDIIGYNRAGEPQEGAELDRQDLRIYALAYWHEDPDGYPLYIYNNPEGSTQNVHKMNPDDGEVMFVAELDPDASGRPAGAFISNQYDIYNWVFISMVNDGAEDRMNVHQLDSRRDWFQLEPMEGMISAGESQAFDLLLDASGWVTDVVLEGSLFFDHNGFDGETNIFVRLNVIGEDEPQPPSPFDLVEPADSSVINAGESQLFAWRESVDPNPDDVVSYCISLYAGEPFEEEFTFDIADTTTDIQPDTLLLNPVTCWFTWWVEAVSGEDIVECNARFSFLLQADYVDDGEIGLPEEFAIQGVYPNPFNARTRINYSLNMASQTQLRVFDFTGREVAVIDYGQQAAGWYRTTIDASAWSSGVYIIRLTAGSEVRTAKLLCIK